MVCMYATRDKFERILHTRERVTRGGSHVPRNRERVDAMVAGKCDGAKIKSTHGTNKTGEKGTRVANWGEGKVADVPSRVSLT